MPYKGPLYNEILNYLDDRQILLVYFIRALDKIGFDSGIVITKDVYKEEKINDKQILMVPVWAFVLFKHEFLDNRANTPVSGVFI